MKECLMSQMMELSMNDSARYYNCNPSMISLFNN